MKLISWNVNGLRACYNKGDFMRFFTEADADAFCIQETKMQPDQLKLELEGYYQYFNSAVRKGYSGVAVFSKIKPLSVSYGINIEKHDQEGRVLTLEYPAFYLVSVYTPNSKDGLLRIDYRMEWEDAFRAYLHKLEESKPVVVCGDFNIAHREIDLANPRENAHNTGFLPEERAFLDRFTAAGYLDTFRLRHGEERDRYSWWSYKTRARARNVGWRIDYFFVSEELREQVAGAEIEDGIYGSDHCPVTLELDLPG